MQNILESKKEVTEIPVTTTSSPTAIETLLRIFKQCPPENPIPKPLKLEMIKVKN